MAAEELKVELCLRRERIFHVRIQVDGQQTATVVGTEGNFAAGVCRNRLKAEVGVAVGQAFADNRVPEQHTRLRALPSVVHNFLPQSGGIYFLLHLRLFGVDGILLAIGLALRGAAHKFVVDAHTHVGTRHAAFRHLGVDKRLSVGVLDAHAEHQCAAPSVLRHLARGVAESFHKRHEARGRERGVFHGRPFRADTRKVVTHAAAPFHELHLLLVFLHNRAVGVGVAVYADHEAVGERGDLEIVADARHGAACGNDVAEVVDEVEDFFLGHGVRILALDACQFRGDAMVHICGRLLENIAEGVLHGIFVHPHARGQLVAGEIVERGLKRLVVRINSSLMFHLSI